jgi:uncharacterized protein YfaP (DUF2135 family)
MARMAAAPVVIVTVLDSETFSKPYIDGIKENRIEYAKRHGEIALKLQFFVTTTSKRGFTDIPC